MKVKSYKLQELQEKLTFKASIEISFELFRENRKFARNFTFDQFPSEIRENFSCISEIEEALKTGNLEYAIVDKEVVLHGSLWGKGDHFFTYFSLPEIKKEGNNEKAKYFKQEREATVNQTEPTKLNSEMEMKLSFLQEEINSLKQQMPAQCLKQQINEVEAFEQEKNKLVEEMKTWRKDFAEVFKKDGEEIDHEIYCWKGKYKGEMKNGEPYGRGHFYSKSQSDQIEAECKNGRLHGKVYTIIQNPSSGTIECFSEYKNGQREGKEIRFDERGCYIFELQNEHGHGNRIQRSVDGTLKKGKQQHWCFQGLVQTYRPVEAFFIFEFIENENGCAKAVIYKIQLLDSELFANHHFEKGCYFYDEIFMMGNQRYMLHDH